MCSVTEERILYCGTNNEIYYIIIDKIDNKYRIDLCNRYVYFVDNIDDIGEEFVKYVKIMIDSLYNLIRHISASKEQYQSFIESKKQYNKLDLLYDNLMLLDKTNLEESNKILKCLKSNNLIVCRSNLLDTYLHNKLVAKCSCKKNKFILTNYILNEIKDEYKINIKLTKQLCDKIIKFHI
jgi:hypothetical protein